MDLKVFLNTVRQSFERYHMNFDGNILLGLSGGADSMALLLFLKHYCKEQGKTLFCVHVNHMMRGEEALRDEQFCRAFCKDHDIPLKVIAKDVPQLIRQTKCSAEEAARRLRYEAFAEAAEHFGVSCIATAHNLDDNAETMLFSLFRGASLRTVCGIPPVHEFVSSNGVCLRLIRPLIELPKEEIERFCLSADIPFVFDSTNDSDQYTRNYIRNRILPCASHVNERALDNMLRTADLLRSDESFIDSCAEEYCARFQITSSAPREAFEHTHDAVASRILMKMSRKVSFAPLSYRHIQSALAMIRSPIFAKELHFSEGLRLYIGRSEIHFTCEEPHVVPIEDTVLKWGENRFDQNQFLIYLCKDGEENPDDLKQYKNIYKKSIKAILNSDKILGELKLRSPKYSEKYIYGGILHSVKKTLSDKKIPWEKRKKIPAVYDDAGIVWIPFCSPRDDVKLNGKESTGIGIYYFEM